MFDHLTSHDKVPVAPDCRPEVGGTNVTRHHVVAALSHRVDARPQDVNSTALRRRLREEMMERRRGLAPREHVIDTANVQHAPTLRQARKVRLAAVDRRPS